MKQMSKWSVLLVFGLVCFFIQTGWAQPPWMDSCTEEITGVICEIYTVDLDGYNAIGVFETENPEYECTGNEALLIFYHIPFVHLATKHEVDLSLGDQVDIVYSESESENPEADDKVCEINGIILFPANVKSKNITPVKQGHSGYQGGRAF